MLSISGSDRVYLACGATDMRKSIDGLAGLVAHAFDLDPFSDAWFVFCNKGCNKLKILHWDHNGFWLYYRRLEKGRFEWPPSQPLGNKAPHVVTHRELGWLLNGLTLEQKKAHGAVRVLYSN